MKEHFHKTTLFSNPTMVHQLTILHLNVDGTVTKTLGDFYDRNILKATSLHPSYGEFDIYTHVLKNPWKKTRAYEEEECIEDIWAATCHDFTSSEEENEFFEEEGEPLDSYVIVLHAYNDRAVRTCYLKPFEHKVLNRALKGLFPQSNYYGNAAIVKLDPKTDSPEHIEEDWDDIVEHVSRCQWCLDIDGHIQHAREYMILGRKVEASSVIEHCPKNPDVEADMCISRDVHDLAAYQIRLRDVQSRCYDIYGGLGDMYLGRRLDAELSRELRDPNFTEEDLKNWLFKLTRNSDYELLTILSWLN